MGIRRHSTLPARALLLGLIAAALAGPASAQTPVSGPRRAAVLFARFADEAAADSLAPPWSAAIFDPARRGSLAHFYDRMSFGALQLRGDVARRRYAVAHPAAWYAPDGAPTRGRYREFALDVLRQADADVDFSRFDDDGDGEVDAVFIVLSSTPANFINAGATGVGNLGLDTVYVTDDTGPDGAPVRIAPEKGTLQRGRSLTEAVGSMAHEYGHILGLADLYNLAYAQSDTARPPAADDAGIGAWGLMGWGTDGWPGGSGGPAALSAWSRLRLGWAEVHPPGPADGTIRLEPVATTGQLLKLPLSANEYFLLEYRTRDGVYDRDIPAPGLLVWHVSRFERDGDAVHRTRVDLECADGRWRESGYPLGRTPDPTAGGDNLDFWAHDAAYRQAHGGNLGDATDPFDGVRARAFTPESNPASTSLDGSLSVRLEDIHVTPEAVTARVALPPPFLELTRFVLLQAERDDAIFSGEMVTLLLGLENQGGVELAQVRTRLVSDDPFISWILQEASFGDLSLGQGALIPQGNRYPSFRVAGDFSGVHHARLALQLFSGDEFLVERPLTLDVYGTRLDVRQVAVVDTSGNGDGVAQPGELVALDLEVPGDASLDSAATAGWRWALSRLRASLRPLEPQVTTIDAGSGRLALTADGPRWTRAPEYRLGADLETADLPDPGHLRFELTVRSPQETWLDTLAIPFATSADRTPPRLGALRIARVAAGVAFALPAARIAEAGRLTGARAVVFRLADTLQVATVDLTRQTDGGFVGVWTQPPEGTWLVRTEATDDAGNTGLAPLQVLSTLRAPVASGADGAPWTPLPPLPRRLAETPASLVAAPSDADVLYLAGQRSLWRSDDGGGAWQPVQQRLARYTGSGWFGVDAADPYTLYDLSTPVARVSHDGGASWTPIPGAGDDGLVVSGVDPMVPGRLFGLRQRQGAPAEGLVSTDGGRTWQGHEAAVGRVLGSPADPAELYAGYVGGYDAEASAYLPTPGGHSIDGGRTWETFPAVHAFHQAGVDPLGGGRLYGAAADTLYASDDHGRTWTRLRVFDVGTAYIQISVHPVSPQLLVWSYLGTWISRDGGLSWTALQLPGDGYPSQVWQHPADPDRLYILQQTRLGATILQTSADGGLTWDDVPMPDGPAGAEALAFAPDGRLLAGTAVSGADGRTIPAIAVRDGDGWSWRQDDSAPSAMTTEPVMGDLVVDPGRPEHVLAMVAGRLLSSADAGRTWSPHAEFLYLPSAQAAPLVADPRHPGTYYVGGDGLRVTRDYGATWERRFSANRRADGVLYINTFAGIAVDWTDPPTVYAAMDSSLWRSDDGGVTWDEDYVDLDFRPRLLVQAPGAPMRLYAAAATGFYRSDDRGRTWDHLADFGGAAVSPARLRFHPHDRDRLYLVGSGVGGVLGTRDGGITWRALPPGVSPRLHIYDVAVERDSGQLLAATPWGVYRLDEPGGTAVTDVAAAAVPTDLTLDPAYPNPFNSDTVIPFGVARSGPVELTVYNVAGQRLRVLLDAPLSAGRHRVRWDGTGQDGGALASGVYLCVLRDAQDQRRTRRLLLLK